MKIQVRSLPLLFLMVSCKLCAQGDGFSLQSKNIGIKVSKQGKIIAITDKINHQNKNLVAFTAIEGFKSKKDIVLPASNKNSLSFAHDLYSDSLKQSCKLVETFTSTINSIRWQIEIIGGGPSWSSAINTIIKYPKDQESRFWTSWGAPQFDSASTDTSLIASLSPYKNNKNPGWLDPLVPMPFTSRTFYYGAPPFDYSNTGVGFIPYQGNLFAIPFASVFEEKLSSGFSIFLSPEDDIINLLMKTEADGTIEFNRLFNRISNNRKVTFSLDLAIHENDWRSSLKWFADRYPGYVNPKIASASQLGGTAAYSNFFEDFDAAKMKKMAFTVNWQASFDFPYMGMFLPPVKRDEQWPRLGGGSISIKQMDDYALKMKQHGFYVMSYFNVTEFGSFLKYPSPPLTTTQKDLWKDCSNYLAQKFPRALLKVADRVVINQQLDPKTIHGGPYYSWKDAVAMDCGDSSYQQFLLIQAQRHIKEIPNSFGICIDRLDWLRFFNEEADDGITWFDNKPARSLVTSWKALMEKLGPLMHNAGKYILVNNHYKRIDLLKHADGILDEFTNATTPLNTTAFLAISKPALGWTPGKEVIESVGGDNFFQKYLYLGVFPMCPFPGNDHALQPDSMVDKLYLDYGPLMNQLKNKQWVLKPGVIKVTGDKAKVNLFKTKTGYAIPVVYGEQDIVTVVLHDALFATRNFKYLVYQPGVTDALIIKAKQVGSAIELNIPLIRGAAMVAVCLNR